MKKGKIERFVMGLDRQTYIPVKTVKNCCECGKPLYFTDEWDWNKYKPICQDCLLKRKKIDKFILHKKTLKNTMKYTGFSEDEIKEIYKQLVERIKRKKPLELAGIGG
jgi:predicted amidophosphoribosyltransferase